MFMISLTNIVTYLIGTGEELQKIPDNSYSRALYLHSSVNIALALGMMLSDTLGRSIAPYIPLAFLSVADYSSRDLIEG